MPYKHGVTGSSPVVPTTLKNAQHYVLCFFMCRETTSGSNKAVSPPLRTPCAPVPQSHCTLASKCKHFRFAVDEPCCPHVINCAFDQTNSFYLFVCLMLVYSFSTRVHSIPRGPHILKKAHQDDVLFLLYIWQE